MFCEYTMFVYTMFVCVCACMKITPEYTDTKLEDSKEFSKYQIVQKHSICLLRGYYENLPYRNCHVSSKKHSVLFFSLFRFFASNFFNSIYISLFHQFHWIPYRTYWFRSNSVFYSLFCVAHTYTHTPGKTMGHKFVALPDRLLFFFLIFNSQSPEYVFSFESSWNCSSIEPIVLAMCGIGRRTIGKWRKKKQTQNDDCSCIRSLALLAHFL